MKDMFQKSGRAGTAEVGVQMETLQTNPVGNSSAIIGTVYTTQSTRYALLTYDDFIGTID